MTCTWKYRIRGKTAVECCNRAELLVRRQTGDRTVDRSVCAHHAEVLKQIGYEVVGWAEGAGPAEDLDILSTQEERP
jgi:hypothetical protein